MKNSTNAGICSRIRQLRVEYAGARGKAEFAKDIGISPSTYYYYETSRVPSADVLVRIAELTHADLRWLLTGEEGQSGVPAGHPAVARAARLLSDRPEYASALTNFADLLAEIAETLGPADQGQAEGSTSRGAKGDAQRPPAGSKGKRGLVESAEPPSGGNVGEGDGENGDEKSGERQGAIPILGRSAAGIPHFWRDAGDGRGVTTLADLVAKMKPRAARRVAQAEAVGELAGDRVSVQLVLLDSPEPPGTAEFVVADHISRAYEDVFGVRIDGDSMAPEIRHGDVVILSLTRPAEQGRSAVVQLKGQIGVTCKLFRAEGDQVHLIPINEIFPPVRYHHDQLDWALKVISRIRSK